MATAKCIIRGRVKGYYRQLLNTEEDEEEQEQLLVSNEEGVYIVERVVEIRKKVCCPSPLKDSTIN